MGGEVGFDGAAMEWEVGLPSFKDLAPLSQSLIPMELAWAFKISPEEPRSMLDVNRASEDTLSSLCGRTADLHLEPFDKGGKDHVMGVSDGAEEGSEQKKPRRMDDSADDVTDETETETETAKDQKRPRLVWTPQLHKRFVEVVAYLGLNNAVPKSIMQLMNVEGLTRENVASHLQKYRLYLRRVHESPSLPLPMAVAADHLLSFTSAPRRGSGDASFHGGGNENEHMRMPTQIPILPHPQQPIMAMPVVGMQAHSGSGYNGYESSQSHNHNHFLRQSNCMVNGLRDWSSKTLN